MVFYYEATIFSPCYRCNMVEDCLCNCPTLDDFLATHPTYSQNHSYFVGGYAPTYSAAANVVGAFLRGMSSSGRGFEGFTVRIRPYE